MTTPRYQQAKRITIIGAGVNALLGVSKILFGWLGHSQALIADGVHSLSDLLTDFLVLFASRYGSQAADSDHPYGHQRIETAATVLLSLFLIIAGLGIIIDAAVHLAAKEFVKPNSLVLFVALFSVFANEALYHYTLRVAKKIKSELLRANAWHHRSDAASSIVVLLGVVGALFGFVYLDEIAAVVVGLMIINMGWKLGWSSILELVDTGVEDKVLKQLKEIISSIPGVRELHQLRTRSMGGNVLVDVHILVNPRLSVSEGHHIGQKVHQALETQMESVSDVTVHIDPEDDEIAAPSRDLPGRDQILPLLHQAWQVLPHAKQISDVTFHYLDGKLYIEITIPMKDIDTNVQLDSLNQQYMQALSRLNYVAGVNILFSA